MNNLIAVALPWHDSRRAAVLGMDRPVDAACVLQPCSGCGVLLAMSPFLALTLAAETAMALCCPACAVSACAGAERVISLTLAADDARH